MHQLLLCIELLGTAVPVAIGFIHSLRLRFPILLLQIFPNIKHPQQGVLGEHSQMSTPRYDPSCLLLLEVVPQRSVKRWGSGEVSRPGEYLGACGSWTGDVTLTSLLWVFHSQRAAQAPLQL